MLNRPRDRETALQALDRADRILSRGYLSLLGLISTVVVLGGLVVIITMDEASASQGGRVYAGAAVLVLLGWVYGQYRWLQRRRRSPMGQRRRPSE